MYYFVKGVRVDSSLTRFVVTSALFNLHLQMGYVLVYFHTLWTIIFSSALLVIEYVVEACVYTTVNSRLTRFVVTTSLFNLHLCTAYISMYYHPLWDCTLQLSQLMYAYTYIRFHSTKKLYLGRSSGAVGQLPLF